MAVSNAVYKIILKASQVRISNGESSTEVIESYNKLSKEQATQLTKDLKLLGYIE